MCVVDLFANGALSHGTELHTCSLPRLNLNAWSTEISVPWHCRRRSPTRLWTNVSGRLRRTLTGRQVTWRWLLQSWRRRWAASQWSTLWCHCWMVWWRSSAPWRGRWGIQMYTYTHATHWLRPSTMVSFVQGLESRKKVKLLAMSIVFRHLVTVNNEI